MSPQEYVTTGATPPPRARYDRPLDMPAAGDELSHEESESLEDRLRAVRANSFNLGAVADAPAGPLSHEESEGLEDRLRAVRANSFKLGGCCWLLPARRRGRRAPSKSLGRMQSRAARWRRRRGRRRRRRGRAAAEARAAAAMRQAAAAEAEAAATQREAQAMLARKEAEAVLVRQATGSIEEAANLLAQQQAEEAELEEEEALMEQDDAAARVQSVQRGNSARRAIQHGKEVKAATTVQAGVRGKAAREGLAANQEADAEMARLQAEVDALQGADEQVHTHAARTALTALHHNAHPPLTVSPSLHSPTTLTLTPLTHPPFPSTHSLAR